jgi:hypothetical protein
MKILYLVIHTEKQKERHYNIMQTWGKDVDVIFYSDFESESNVIKVTDKNDYNSGEDKQINIINEFPSDKLNYDWYFFVDNDSFVNTNKLFDFIHHANENKVYGEVMNTWAVDLSLYYCLGGAGILMSRKILLELIGKLKYNNVGWGDVSLGINLRKLSISVENSNLFHSQLPEFYKIDEKEIKNFITFHYVKTFDHMNRLYSLLISD